MPNPDLKLFVNAEFTSSPTTGMSYLTAVALTADSGNPSISGNISSNTLISWNITNEALTGFDISVSLLSSAIQTIITSQSSVTVSTSVSAETLTSIQLVDPTPETYGIFFNNNGTVTFFFDVTSIGLAYDTTLIDSFSSITYNTTFFYKDVTAFTYYPINSANPLTHTIHQIKTNNTIPPLSAVLAKSASAVQIKFFTNYDTNTPLNHDFIISAVKINNEPFVRSVTASIIQNPLTVFKILPNQPILWLFDTNTVWATTTANLPYNRGTQLPLSSIGTLFFYLTAPTYDFKIQTAPIFTTGIILSAPQQAQQKILEIKYDAFPNLDLYLFANYERTNASSYFYRLTSTTPYFVNINSQSTDFNFNNNFVDTNYRGYYTLNNQTQRLTSLSLSANFVCNSPTISSIQLYLSANTPQNSLGPWYTPHTFNRTISARFVSYFPQTDFIGFPDSYFDTKTTVKYLSASNYLESPGMSFYGEGHTGTIYLCSTPQPPGTLYNWSFIGPTTQYSFTAVNIETLQLQPGTSLSSVAVRIPTLTGDSFKIPVFLRLTDSNFTSSDPIYYYDDVSGQLLLYPYCITTVDADNNELFLNTRNRQSITIKPYTLPRYKFTTNMRPIEVLLANGTRKFYEANLQLLGGLDTCYDKYGLLWKWSGFENCQTIPNTFVGKPSSWATMQCSISAGSWPPIPDSPGKFPKKWRFEGPLSAEIFDVDPLSCVAGLITWNLSSSTGWPSIPLTTSLTKYPFNLRAQEFGTLRLTTSVYNPTDVSVTAQQSITCHITASNVPTNNQWIPRTTTITAISTSKVLTSPEVRLYTSNKYVLTGTEVKFENLITQRSSISALYIDFDDGISKTFFGSDINSQFFTISGYNSLGYKTITVTVNTGYSEVPSITTTLKNAIFVTDQYDVVEPTEYQTDKEPISLPWPNRPVIGSNDWVNDDNINSCLQKFYDNLNYLKTRGRVYKSTYDEFYGYLGVPVPSAVNPAGCIAWTWEDLDPLNTSLPYNVTWKDVFYTGNSVSNGSQIECGKWVQHIRNINTQLPMCYGLYEADWNWRSLKEANSQTRFTWKNTKCDQDFNKRWYYEPGNVTSFIICDEGNWNVNIPNLDKYYPVVANNYIQQRCIYYGIASRNNTLYTAQKTQIKLLSSDYTATYFDGRFTIDKVREFSDLKNICLDSSNKIYILDGLQSQISVFTYDIAPVVGDNWQLFTTWGGFGGRGSNTKLYLPNDIHIDQLDNVFVADTGNNCIKHFSNTGSWIQTITDSVLLSSTIFSVAVDSEQKLHVLTDSEIRVYTYEGDFEFAYAYKDYTSATPRKINTSYNREILYIVLDTEVIKFFRNGIFAGTIIRSSDNITNITSLYHDEFRNLLITSNDKILKYVDTMSLIQYIGTLPSTYWSLSDIYIHQDEYVQNWVYTKAFQKLWDNIEIFKNSLAYSTTDKCKQYKLSSHGKEKMIIGQNEIVTSTAINRVLTYLWENLSLIVEYFNPNCKP